MFRFSKRNDPTIAEILALHNAGMIGTIESRSWLANLFPDFRDARREDVDNALEQLGSEITNRSDLFDDTLETENDFGA